MEKVKGKVESVLSMNGEADGIPTDGTGKLPISLAHVSRSLIFVGVIKQDPWLEPFKDSLKHRFAKAQEWIKKIDETEGGLEKFSRVGIFEQQHGI